MFGISGESDLTEKTLDHLSGYGGSRPVRIGNGAYKQRQNDVFGALLDSIYIHSKTREGVRRADGPDRLRAGRGSGLCLAHAGPGHLGVPRRAEALRVLEAHGLGGARPRGTARPELRRDDLAENWAREAETVKADILDRGVYGPRHVSPALRDRRARRVAAPHPADPLPALPRTSASRRRS